MSEDKDKVELPGMLRAVLARIGWPGLLMLWLIASSGGWADVLLSTLLGVPGAITQDQDHDGDEIRGEIELLRAEIGAEAEHARAMRAAALVAISRVEAKCGRQHGSD